MIKSILLLTRDPEKATLLKEKKEKKRKPYSESRGKCDQFHRDKVESWWFKFKEDSWLGVHVRGVPSCALQPFGGGGVPGDLQGVFNRTDGADQRGS
ncbi:unnamed protein product [Leptidea sinapis]|uniref:Uncharacterized protein n=1 Tax=Leptidea sinapis TaxID=189913 RepID=A0A5E4QTB8_9NEOP|nr:unnamed protein product [Leptidea sinapis]